MHCIAMYILRTAYGLGVYAASTFINEMTRYTSASCISYLQIEGFGYLRQAGVE